MPNYVQKCTPSCMIFIEFAAFLKNRYSKEPLWKDSSEQACLQGTEKQKRSNNNFWQRSIVEFFVSKTSQHQQPSNLYLFTFDSKKYLNHAFHPLLNTTSLFSQHMFFSCSIMIACRSVSVLFLKSNHRRSNVFCSISEKDP